MIKSFVFALLELESSTRAIFRSSNVELRIADYHSIIGDPKFDISLQKGYAGICALGTVSLNGSKSANSLVTLESYM